VNPLLRACAACVVAIATLPVRALTLDFDDLPPAGGVFGVDAPALYLGFDFGTGRWAWSADTGALVAASPPLAIRTEGSSAGSLVSAIIAGTTPFTFTSASFSGTPTPIYIELVGADGVTTVRLGGFPPTLDDPSTATFRLSSGDGAERFFVNPLPDLALSSIVISGRDGAFAVDDLVLSPATPAPVEPVPEPGTLALMIAGLACIGVVALRRRPGQP